MNGFPFSFLENAYNLKNTILQEISRPTFMKNMQLLTKDLKMKISEWLPSTFSMIERYFALESVLQKRDPDIASMLPTASDNIELQLLLTEFESISKSYRRMAQI